MDESLIQELEYHRPHDIILEPEIDNIHISCNIRYATLHAKYTAFLMANIPVQSSQDQIEKLILEVQSLKAENKSLRQTIHRHETERMAQLSRVLERDIIAAKERTALEIDDLSKQLGEIKKALQLYESLSSIDCKIKERYLTDHSDDSRVKCTLSGLLFQTGLQNIRLKRLLHSVLKYKGTTMREYASIEEVKDVNIQLNHELRHARRTIEKMIANNTESNEDTLQSKLNQATAKIAKLELDVGRYRALSTAYKLEYEKKK